MGKPNASCQYPDGEFATSASSPPILAGGGPIGGKVRTVSP